MLVSYWMDHSDTLQSCSANDSDVSLQSIICLLEALQASSITGSIDLARALLDVLQAVSYNHVPSRSDIDYVEQLLISVLESVVIIIKVSVVASKPMCEKLRTIFTSPQYHLSLCKLTCLSVLLEVSHNPLIASNQYQ